MYLHNILQGSGKGGRKVPPILTAISLILRVGIVFHVPRTCKPTCSIVMAPQVIWEPVSPCKYCVVCTRPHDSCPSVCKYASERWSHLSNVTLWPCDSAVERKSTLAKAQILCPVEPFTIHFYFSFIFKEKGLFICVACKEILMCMHVCACEGERQQEGENQVENMTKAIKGTKLQKINQPVILWGLWTASWHGSDSSAPSLMLV